MSATGVYVHFPFCVTRCSYCDFATVAGEDALVPRYLDALEREIGSFEPRASCRADTVFVGGGTPSRMSPDEMRRVIGAVCARFEVEPDAEVTIEGNPESLTAEHLDGYLEAGVTRVCVGVQSLDDEALARAGRPHDAREALEAIARVRMAGFASAASDLIAGLPGEDLSHWAITVERIAAAGPDHVSVYLLETDKDTPVSRAIRSGRIAGPDDDEAVVAYEATVETLERAGLALYEISNFARPGHASRHNLKYWSDQEFAGFGLGAHAYLAGARRANTRDLTRYLDRVESGLDPVEWHEEPDAALRASEALVMGLRRVEGVDLDAIGRRYGLDLGERHRAAWERAGEAGMIERRGSLVRLTGVGRVRSNELFVELI